MPTFNETVVELVDGVDIPDVDIIVAKDVDGAITVAA